MLVSITCNTEVTLQKTNTSLILPSLPSLWKGDRGYECGAIYRKCTERRRGSPFGSCRDQRIWLALESQRKLYLSESLHA